MLQLPMTMRVSLRQDGIRREACCSYTFELPKGGSGAVVGSEEECVHKTPWDFFRSLKCRPTTCDVTGKRFGSENKKRFGRRRSVLRLGQMARNSLR